jgi:hypothetical protein
MGYYIETASHKNKAQWLRDNAKAVNAPGERNIGTHDMIPVVVVDNGPFEAAAIAYDRNELEVFTDRTDPRPRECLLVPRDEVIKLCPEVEHALKW